MTAPTVPEMKALGLLPATPSVPTEGQAASVLADVRSEQARAMFPDEWQRMEGLTGKPRTRLRARLKNQADYLHGMKMLPVEARCGNCKHMIMARLTKPTPACDLDSDFHGYALTTRDRSCPRWVKARTAAEAGAMGTRSQSDGVTP